MTMSSEVFTAPILLLSLFPDVCASSLRTGHAENLCTVLIVKLAVFLMTYLSNQGRQASTQHVRKGTAVPGTCSQHQC